MSSSRPFLFSWRSGRAKRPVGGQFPRDAVGFRLIGRELPRPGGSDRPSFTLSNCAEIARAGPADQVGRNDWDGFGGFGVWLVASHGKEHPKGVDILGVGLAYAETLGHSGNLGAQMALADQVGDFGRMYLRQIVIAAAHNAKLGVGKQAFDALSDATGLIRSQSPQITKTGEGISRNSSVTPILELCCLHGDGRRPALGSNASFELFPQWPEQTSSADFHGPDRTPIRDPEPSFPQTSTNGSNRSFTGSSR